LTRPVTYVSNFNHLLSFMLRVHRVHNTFHHRQFGFLGLTGSDQFFSFSRRSKPPLVGDREPHGVFRERQVDR
jgi:hypothetical protein